MSLVVFLTVLIACCAFALWRGGAAERWAAGLQLGAFALDELLHRTVDGGAYRSVAAGSFSIDVALLVAFTWLSHRSTRFWPLWLAAWQAAAISGHVAKFLDPRMAAAGYAFQTQLWAYPMLVLLAIGTARHCRRVAAGDPDLSWKSQLG